MKKGRSCTQRGRATEMLYAENRTDTAKWLGDMGDEKFLVLDTRVTDMFPSRELPEKCVVADWSYGMDSMDSVMELLLRARRLGVRKGDRWIVIGGSMTLDIASLASLLYYGGTRLTLIPSTLIAMTDTAIGGKCGINYPGERNLCYTVNPPDDVVIDMKFLSRNSEDDVRNGLGEILKHSIIAPGPGLMDTLLLHRNDIRSLDRGKLIGIMEESIDTKIMYLEAGEEDEGLGRALDLGHRFAYGFMTGNEITRDHGKAVVWGIDRAVELGLSLGITDAAFAEKIRALIKGYGYDTSWRFPKTDAMKYVSSYFMDPVTGKLEMLVPERQGKLVAVQVGYELVQKLICS